MTKNAIPMFRKAMFPLMPRTKKVKPTAKNAPPVPASCLRLSLLMLHLVSRKLDIETKRTGLRCQASLTACAPDAIALTSS